MGAAKILVVEDEAFQLKLALRQLTENGFDAEGSTSAKEAIEKYKNADFDLVITDYKMPDMNGIDFLCEIKRLDPEATIIFVTGFGTIDLAVSAMKKGAFDFLTKPYSTEVLLYTVKRALQVKSLEQENIRLHMELMDRFSFSHIVGGSPVMKELFKKMTQVAMSDAPCLLEGEIGSGKEIIARAVHYEGLRKSKPFLRVNCALSGGELLAVELSDNFKKTPGGTIFFDEIGEMPIQIQENLLGTLPSDVRILAATSRPLSGLVQKKEFREDLYRHLKTSSLEVPPLRDRKEDIPLLVRHFLVKSSQPHRHVDPNVVQLFLKYDWPGNVRELENIIERMLIISPFGKTLQVADVPLEIREHVGIPTR